MGETPLFFSSKVIYIKIKSLYFMQVSIFEENRLRRAAFRLQSRLAPSKRVSKNRSPRKQRARGRVHPNVYWKRPL